MNLPSMPRMSECWALSRLDKTMLSPILSLDTSAKAPVPSLLPCMPDLKWVLLPCPLGIGLSFSNNRPRKSVLLLLRGWFRRLMAALAGIVVLVVIAFLVEATAADRELALPRLRPRAMNGDVAGIATRGLLEFSCVRHIRFALENAHLLLVGLSALHVQSPGVHRPLRGEPLRATSLSIPPATFTSFSTSPSIVFSPRASSMSSGDAPAMVAPFDPPIRGLSRISLSVGVYSFGCLLLMVTFLRPSRQHRACDGNRARLRRRTPGCGSAADRPRAASLSPMEPLQVRATRRVRPDEYFSVSSWMST